MSNNNIPPSKRRNNRVHWEKQDGRQKSWECRGCGRIEYGEVAPLNWYQLSRSSGQVMYKPARLGVCCSVDCLRKHIETVVAIQEPNTPIFRGQEKGFTR